MAPGVYRHRNTGSNHVRYLRGVLPEAAFEAADQLVFTYKWRSQLERRGRPGFRIQQILYDETDRIMKEYGNHPSFMFYTYGNEPSGEGMQAFLNEFVGHYKKNRPPA